MVAPSWLVPRPYHTDGEGAATLIPSVQQALGHPRTKAISVGGNSFRDKWGTPDVIGIREARRSDIIKPPTEIVAAELKLDVGGLITAFGQACAYKLFAHRSYIVIPRGSSEDDISRLDSLARIFGIGLILFSADDAKHPDFSIRARAARHEPDIFYVNRYLKLIEDQLF